MDARSSNKLECLSITNTQPSLVLNPRVWERTQDLLPILIIIAHFTTE
jgi:hypothetical protein